MQKLNNTICAICGLMFVITNFATSQVNPQKRNMEIGRDGSNYSRNICENLSIDLEILDFTIDNENHHFVVTVINNGEDDMDCLASIGVYIDGNNIDSFVCSTTPQILTWGDLSGCWIPLGGFNLGSGESEILNFEWDDCEKTSGGSDCEIPCDNTEHPVCVYVDDGNYFVPNELDETNNGFENSHNFYGTPLPNLVINDISVGDETFVVEIENTGNYNIQNNFGVEFYIDAEKNGCGSCEEPTVYGYCSQIISGLDTSQTKEVIINWGGDCEGERINCNIQEGTLHNLEGNHELCVWVDISFGGNGAIVESNENDNYFSINHYFSPT